MGLIVVAVGSAFDEPAAWPAVSAAIVLFAFHHAVAKGALFLGVGIAASHFDVAWKKWLVGAGLLLPALALAGAPFTLGSVAKLGLTQATTASAMPWSDVCGWLLPLSSIATTLLMARFLWRVWPRPDNNRYEIAVGMWLPWSILSASVVASIAFLPWYNAIDHPWLQSASGGLWKTAWPIMAGAGLVILVLFNRQLAARLSRLRIPPGDVGVPIAALSVRLAVLWHRCIVKPVTHRCGRFASWWSAASATNISSLLARAEASLENWGATGVFVALVGAAFYLLLAF
jgi:hypothetical protein